MLARVLSGQRPLLIADLVEIAVRMQALDVLAKLGFCARPERDW